MPVRGLRTLTVALICGGPLIAALQCAPARNECAAADVSCAPLRTWLILTSNDAHADPCNIETATLVACYKFENSTQDSGANGWHGTLNGTADFPAGAGGTSDFAYHVSQGDTGSYILLPDGVFTGRGDFTVSFWGKIDDLGSHLHYFLNVSNGTATSGEVLGVSWATANNFQVNLDTTVGVAIVGTTGPRDFGWHHYAYIREGSEIRLYLDGERINTTGPISTNQLSSGPNGALIGQEADSCCPAGTFDGAQNMGGSIDNLIIYGSAFDDDGVRLLFHATL